MPVITDNIALVATSDYAELSKEIISKAYQEAFDMKPCGTCGKTDFFQLYMSIKKHYEKITSNMAKIKTDTANYYWNPEYNGTIIYYAGEKIVVGEDCEQFILEAIYNDPNRKGMVFKKEEIEQTQKNK